MWTQVSGTTVEISNADTASASFTAPDYIEDDATSVFMVEVSDGTDTISQSFTVMVTDVPEPVVAVPKPKKSSGGSTGLLALLLVPLAFLRRRK